MWLLRVFSSVIFLTSIVLSIPLAFDVGGRTCGLAFSLALATYYFIHSILRLATPDESRVRAALVRTVGAAQVIVLPSLLIWSLNRFAVDADNAGWVERTFKAARSKHETWSDWIFGHDGMIEAATIGSWDRLLRWSTPFFQMVEGFCSLLVIQATGQITRWTVNRSNRSDSWMIAFLVLSASIISSSVYFLWRVAQFPALDNIDAILIGVSIASAAILGAWGIGSGRGNPVESSLLFAYVVLCVYQIFTDYRPLHPHHSSASPATPQQPDFPPLPPVIMASYTTLVGLLSALPATARASFSFVAAALSTVSPSVLVSLSYRLLVLYASTRIIPAVREAGAARALSQEASLEDADGAGQILGFLSWFSPSILVAVYTSLLMQHFAASAAPGAGGGAGAAAAGAALGAKDAWVRRANAAGGSGWKWSNIIGTMALYALELYLGKDDVDGGLTGHWKTD